MNSQFGFADAEPCGAPDLSLVLLTKTLMWCFGHSGWWYGVRTLGIGFSGVVGWFQTANTQGREQEVDRGTREFAERSEDFADIGVGGR